MKSRKNILVTWKRRLKWLRCQRYFKLQDYRYRLYSHYYSHVSSAMGHCENTLLSFQEAVVNIWLKNNRYEEFSRIEWKKSNSDIKYYKPKFRGSGFGTEISFIKLVKMYPEILKMKNIKPIAFFLNAKLYDLVKDSKKSHEYNICCSVSFRDVGVWNRIWRNWCKYSHAINSHWIKNRKSYYFPLLIGFFLIKS